jgi:hypothetical protein
VLNCCAVCVSPVYAAPCKTATTSHFMDSTSVTTDTKMRRVLPGCVCTALDVLCMLLLHRALSPPSHVSCCSSRSRTVLWIATYRAGQAVHLTSAASSYCSVFRWFSCTGWIIQTPWVPRPYLSVCLSSLQQWMYLTFLLFRLALGPTQPPAQWIQEVLPRE